MSSRRKQIRRVHIDGQEWQYQVARRGVSIRDPDGKRTFVAQLDFQIENDYPTPQDVKDLIWAKLHPVRKLALPKDTADAKAMLINLFCGARKQFAGAQE